MKYAQAAADEGYAYVLQDLEPGRYLVGLSVDRRVLETAELVEVPDYLLQRDLTLPPPDPKRHRAVRVLGPDGSPLEVISFMCSYKTERFSGGGPCTMFARKDGSYLIRTMDWASRGAGEGGTHTLSIRTRDRGTVREPFDPAAPGELVVRVTAQATLHVTLEGYVGSGHEGKVRLALRRASEKDHQRASGRDQPDSKGQQTLGPVPSGEAVLLVGVDQRGFFWIADRIPVNLRPGENRVSVPLPALHEFTVTGQPGERFRISPANEDRDLLIGYWVIQKNGEVIVERLPVGTYEVSGYKDGKKWMRKVTLPGQSTLRLP